jgi:hypothetical protein
MENPMLRAPGLIAAAALALVSLPAQALPSFTATMKGLSEVPPNASPATGFTRVVLNQGAHTIDVFVNWSGLIGGNPSAAHIHCCVAPGTNVGVAVGFPSFPAAVSGTYNHIFDLTDPTIYTTAFRTNFGGGTAAGAEAALILGLNAGTAYSNIHNQIYPGGEIRGLLAKVPEPASLGLFGLGLVAFGFLRRKRTT